MRVFLIVGALTLLAVVAVVTWLFAREPTPAEAVRIAAVLAPTSPPGEPPAYAHCASCHLHDGSGRPDGSIPRLNGQRKAVLQNKLFRLRVGLMRMPVMDPFARTLEPKEISEISDYLAALPETAVAPVEAIDEERAAGASLYSKHCASCHGDNAEGHDGLFASRLCGQYPAYLARRLDEVARKTRGDADAVMQGVLEGVPADALGPIVKWLSAGGGCVAR
ncbi:MAG: c-type cytochrome [Myxococcales bacterium]|nr:MAG: c-type cytochrome [Myxococcales bacterium]